MQDKQDGAESIPANTFGQRVRQRRERAKMTQQQLSERIRPYGVKLDTSAITRIENGSREPRLSEAQGIAAALGIELELLITSESAKLHLSKLWNDLGNAQWGLVDAVYEHGLARRALNQALDGVAPTATESYDRMRLEASWRAIADWPAIKADHDNRVTENPPKDQAVFDAET